MATADVADWTPDAQDVKPLVPRRLDSGPFTTATKPSSDDVAGLIDGVVAEILADLGPIPDDDNLLRVARWAVTLGAAYYVEQNFFPEQQDRDGTAERLHQRYLEQLARLRASLAAFGVDTARQTVGTIRTPSAVVAAASELVNEQAAADYGLDLLAHRNRLRGGL